MRERWARAAFPLVASLLVAAGGIAAYVHHARSGAPEERPRLASLQAFDLETFRKWNVAGPCGVE